MRLSAWTKSHHQILLEFGGVFCEGSSISTRLSDKGNSKKEDGAFSISLENKEDLLR